MLWSPCKVYEPTDQKRNNNVAPQKESSNDTNANSKPSFGFCCMEEREHNVSYHVGVDVSFMVRCMAPSLSYQQPVLRTNHNTFVSSIMRYGKRQNPIIPCWIDISFYYRHRNMALCCLRSRESKCDHHGSLQQYRSAVERFQNTTQLPPIQKRSLGLWLLLMYTRSPTCPTQSVPL